MKLVVTGALGHIGSRLIRAIPGWSPEAHVVMVDDLSTQRYASLFNLPAGRFTFHELDVTEAELEPVFAGAHAVFHLAAITDAAGSFAHRERLEQHNLRATERVAAAAAAVGARLFFLSSTSVYGTADAVVDEDCPESELRPQSPYAETKLREERAVRALSEAGDLRFAICRFGTIFGASPGMRFHTAVNKFCWQAVMGTPLTVWRTAMDQKRPYLDLGDAIRAMRFFVERDLFDGRTYNVLTENLTVRQVVDAIRAVVPALEVTLVDARIMNQLSYDVSVARLRGLGFEAEGALHSAIAETIGRLRQANSAARS
jgi:UDP-glucose 4-epimerase